MSITPRPDSEDGGRARHGVLHALDVVGILVSLPVAAGLLACVATRWGAEHAGLLRQLDLGVLVFFLADVCTRLLLAKQRLGHLRSRWFDLLVLVPLVRAFAGGRTASAWFLVRQVIMLGVAFPRALRMRRLVSQLRLHPARLLVGSFAGAILVGTVLLSLPEASATGKSVGLVDALFTATSATCVTGLIVKNTGADFTLFGQLVILTLLQLGGLGIMTFSVSLALTLGRALSKSREVVMRDVLDQESVGEVLSLLRFIVCATLLMELAGAAALFFSLGAHDGYSLATLYAAIFHSVSAFCNAGFSVFATSFEAYQNSFWVNFVVTTLIVVGGLGFPVLRDLLLIGTRRRLSLGRSPRLRAHTKVVLATSATLIVVGALVFYAVERNGRLADMSGGEKVLASYFQSVTARTAGFNTVRIGQVGHAGLLLLMCLMFIGASPGSTGGGVKTSTAAILFRSAMSALRGRGRVQFFQRTVPQEVVRRAIAVVVLSALVIVVMMIALMSVESQPFEALAFETMSAFGTVGLSMGATPKLTVGGRLIITALMYIGRLGPLTLALSLFGKVRPAAYEYAEERVMVG